jgi:glycosyltransferase involved in cell wall biosynthesis
LQALARATQWSSIKFLGFKNQTELPRYYDLCDVLVLPSVYEPWGLVINEVMNAGRAVIISDQVGCGPDLVHPGVNGYIFPAGDIAALARALTDVLNDPNRPRRMGARSLEIIRHWSFTEDLQGLQQALACLRTS